MIYVIRLTQKISNDLTNNDNFIVDFNDTIENLDSKKVLTDTFM